MADELDLSADDQSRKARALRTEARLRGVERENARRRPCPRCGLAILPETQGRHDHLHHDG